MIERQEDLQRHRAEFVAGQRRPAGRAVRGGRADRAGRRRLVLLDRRRQLCGRHRRLAGDAASPRPRSPRTAPMWHGLWKGSRYAFGFAPIRSLLLLLALVSFMGMPYTVLMPIFAADILTAGPYALGFLSAASGVGGLGRGAVPGLATHACSGWGASSSWRRCSSALG